VKREYDDLSSKSLEAEKEMKLVQMKIQDATNHLSKLQKDLDGNLFIILSFTLKALLLLLFTVPGLTSSCDKFFCNTLLIGNHT
jgi:DNA repair protein RAD50